MNVIMTIVQDCEAVMDHPDLKTAVKLRNVLASGNFPSFYRLATSSSYMIAALAHLYFPSLRAYALTSFSKTRQGKS